MLWTSMAMAVPAHPGSTRITQPDGTQVTIRLHGDEYLHFSTTDDGYSVVRRADGFYAYAQRGANGRLEATSHIAHDPSYRSVAEQEWLQGVEKGIAPAMDATTVLEQQAEQVRRLRAREAAKATSYDYSNFKGLILLVQYNDCEFSRSDYADIVNDMANKENYTGYDNTTYGRYTGSVRDYFYDNSFGAFSPQFDVVGPVTIDKSQYDPKGMDNNWQITLAAVEAADSLVDFSQYDTDNNGEVDMIYFIFAGLGSNIEGNDERLLWPHAGQIYNGNASWNWQVRKDGVTLGRYACSTELYGSSTWSILDGIGTICHEFGHVLGLRDLYDTDYEKSGGESPHPGDWSIMASGSYLNYSRTPVGYTLYERYALGFAIPQLISEEGSYSLDAISETNTGYRLNTPVKKEFFLIENRQQTAKWDKYLPGHGMLVFRCDSTSSSIWQQNKVNINPKHNYFVLLRAGGTTDGTAKASDPFPGTQNVTTLNNVTSPANLLTWAGSPLELGFENIREVNGHITFDIVDVNVLRSISLPEQVTIGKGLWIKLTETRIPDYAPYTLQWSSSNPEIVSVDEHGYITGKALGEADITVIANGDENLKATTHVTVERRSVVRSFSDCRSFSNEANIALLLVNALVVYTHGNDAYVRDATGAIVFANTGLQLAVGDLLNGHVYGKVGLKNNVPHLESLGEDTHGNGYIVTHNNEVTPREVSVVDVNETYYADYITLKAASLVVEPKVAVWAEGGSNKIRLYNTFKVKDGGKTITVPNDPEGKYYDVTGIYLTNTFKGELINELALLKQLVEVEAPPQPDAIEDIEMKSTELSDSQAPISIYTTDGRLIVKTTAAQLPLLNLKHGIYVAKGTNRAWQFVR